MNTFNRVATWNLLCGKTPPEFGSGEYLVALLNQADRIFEEYKELMEAIVRVIAIKDGLSKGLSKTTATLLGETIEVEVSLEELEKWNTEILDAGCDLDVVVSGFNFLAGHDYDGAIDAVLSNNDAKYTGDLEFANKSLESYGEGHRIVTVHHEIQSDSRDEVEESGFKTFTNNGRLYMVVHSVHRDSDDKICKLLNHPKVDLIPFVRTHA